MKGSTAGSCHYPPPFNLDRGEQEQLSKYFPVAVGINDDAEVWTFTDMHGDRSLRTLLEVFRILEENRNRWKLVNRWEYVLARKLRQTPANVSSQVGWMLTRGWLEVHQLSASGRPEVLRARNYSKFRKVAAETTPPLNLTYPNLTELVSSDKNPQIPATPVLPFKDWEKMTSEERHMASMNLSPELKREADRLYYSDPVKFKKLAVWIAQGRKNKYSEPDMAAALREFWDYRVIDEWYEYLDSILDRIVKDRNMNESVAEHEQHKADVREASKMFLVK